MIKTSIERAPISSERFSWWSRWPQWISYAAALWSLLYGVLGLYWMSGGKGFPFGVGDPHPEYSILRGLQVGVGAPIMALLGCAGALVAPVMAQRWGRGVLRMLCTVFAGGMAGILLLVVVDDRLLACIVHALLLHFEMFDWTVINQFSCLAGGILWAATAVVSQRQSRHACAYCGRAGDIAPGWTTPDWALQWGRWAVAIAIVVPLGYSLTRWAFALGIPLGVSQAFLRQMAHDNPGVWLGGGAIATIGLAGAMLTLGLVQRWGEVFPSWMLGLAGKRVPPALAIIPASLVSILALQTGLGIDRHALMGTFAFASAVPGTYVPLLFWPLWGLALGAATLAYYYRRRGRCKHCGRL